MRFHFSLPTAVAAVVAVVIIPRFAGAVERADTNGYRYCRTLIEARGKLPDSTQETCVLQVQCEQVDGATAGASLVRRVAVCEVIPRNNRCKEAADCLADRKVSTEDADKLAGVTITKSTAADCRARAGHLTTSAADLLRDPGPQTTTPARNSGVRSVQ